MLAAHGGSHKNHLTNKGTLRMQGTVQREPFAGGVPAVNRSCHCIRLDIVRSAVIFVIQPPTLIYETTHWQGGVNNNAGEILDLVIVTNEKSKVAPIPLITYLVGNPFQRPYFLASRPGCGKFPPYKGSLSRPLNYRMPEAPLNIIRI